MAAIGLFSESTTWLRARKLVGRAHEHERYRLASEAERRRAARLYARAIRTLTTLGPEPLPADATAVRRRAETLVRIRAAPPLRRFRGWLVQGRHALVAIGVALLAAAAAAWALRAELRLVPDLARGRAWQTSSQLAADSSLLFHTALEASPWAVVDLGARRTFSQIKVRNRNDCCQTRAVPLLVEISGDGASWRLLARREAPFQTWSRRFGSVSARYVRLRVDRASYLHLSNVEIYR